VHTVSPLHLLENQEHSADTLVQVNDLNSNFPILLLNMARIGDLYICNGFSKDLWQGLIARTFSNANDGFLFSDRGIFSPMLVNRKGLPIHVLPLLVRLHCVTLQQAVPVD